MTTSSSLDLSLNIKRRNESSTDSAWAEAMLAGPLELLSVSRFSWTCGMSMGCSSKQCEVALLIDSISRGWCGWHTQLELELKLKFGGPRLKNMSPYMYVIRTWSVTSLYCCHIISGFIIQQIITDKRRLEESPMQRFISQLLYHPPDHPLCSSRTRSLYSSYKFVRPTYIVSFGSGLQGNVVRVQI